jgi:hypothetical protein
VIKVDITAAYMNTPMNDDVKHKWVMLDRHVAEQFMVINPGYWSKFLRRDGRILCKLRALMYGIKEAARYWNKTLVDVFLKAGYKQCAKDKCLIVLRTEDKVSFCGVTVDDCLFVCTPILTFSSEFFPPHALFCQTEMLF